jgi:arylsulfatase A-like enzyme
MDCPVTILDAAGTSFGNPVDGRNLLDLIHDGHLYPGIGNWQDDLMCETHGHHWEPVVGRAIVTQRYHYAVYQYHDQPDYLDEVDTSALLEELYDLQEDPYQLNNLATDHGFQDVIADHRRRLEHWQKQTRDPVHFD